MSKQIDTIVIPDVPNVIPSQEIFVYVSKLESVFKGKVVDSLPDEAEANTLYVISSSPSAIYIWFNDKWLQIGTSDYNSLENKPDLTDYVKNTDYASNSKAGLVKVGNGLYVNASGLMSIVKADKADIDKKISSYNPIVPATLDYAVMKALIDPKNHTWTNEDKSAARATLGITGSDIEIDTEIDSELSTESENAVQNKVITEALDKKLEEEDLTDYAKKEDLRNKVGFYDFNTKEAYQNGEMVELSTVPIFLRSSKGIYLSTAPDGSGRKVLGVQFANENQVKNQRDTMPFSTDQISLAVKAGLTANKLTLTTEEKTSAQNWLGITSGGTKFYAHKFYKDFDVYTIISTSPNVQYAYFSNGDDPDTGVSDANFGMIINTGYILDAYKEIEDISYMEPQLVKSAEGYKTDIRTFLLGYAERYVNGIYELAGENVSSIFSEDYYGPPLESGMWEDYTGTEFEHIPNIKVIKPDYTSEL